MKGLICVLSILIIILNYSCSHKKGTFIDDRDNHVYKWVRIGDQIWMAENLSYNAGYVSKVYDNNSSNEAIYGRLYNWETAQTVCPSGWHLPSDIEWTQLTDFLGGDDIAGGKLKETGTIHWNIPNTDATNETGFSALPGGARRNNLFFLGLHGYGHWWSSTEYDTDNSWFRRMSYNNKRVLRGSDFKESGYSVRCVRD